MNKQHKNNLQKEQSKDITRQCKKEYRHTHERIRDQNASPKRWNCSGPAGKISSEAFRLAEELTLSKAGCRLLDMGVSENRAS